MIPFACFGGAVHYIRSRSTATEPIAASSIVLSTAMLGLDLVSDLLFIILMARGAFLPVTGNIINFIIIELIMIDHN